MSSAQRLCDSVASTLSPITLTPRFSKSGLQRATYPSSVVQTGVKSFGWENRTAQLSPIHSWKLMGPSVVSAVKSGAISPSRRAISLSSSSKQNCPGTLAGKVGMRNKVSFRKPLLQLMPAASQTATLRPVLFFSANRYSSITYESCYGRRDHQEG